MIKVGIVGGAGYTAGELLRILLFHPQVEILSITSTSSAGRLVSDTHQDLLGTTSLKFSANLTGQEDVIFLCLGHGISREYITNNNIPAHTRIIDLGNDFRLDKDANFAQRQFVYGLPELQRQRITTAQNIANPGCFATAIQLALLPLANAGKINQAIHISAITGSTGAGRSLSESVHFTWRNNNISVYKAFTHQHLGEIKESLTQLQGDFSQSINFIPYRGDFTRGIFASVYTPFEGSLADAQALYEAYYQAHPFVTISQADINLKQVVNTNKALLNLQVHDGQLLITTVIDNLVKGASGQAVQNMNLMFGLPETTGLNLKSVMF